LRLGQGGRGKRRHPFECCGRQRFGKERSTAADQLDAKARELIVRAGAPFAKDEVRRLQDRPNVPRTAATDIARLQPMLGGKRANDRAMLAMLANGDDQGFSAEVQDEVPTPSPLGGEGYGDL
jgi:hypothetical protein